MIRTLIRAAAFAPFAVCLALGLPVNAPAQTDEEALRDLRQRISDLEKKVGDGPTAGRTAESARPTGVEAVLPKIHVGAGLRISLNAAEDGSPNGEKRSSDANLDAAEIFLSGRALGLFHFQLNTEIDNAGKLPDGGNIRVLDAAVRFEPNDWFRLQIGRFLIPTDRTNLSGPFLMIPWSMPFVQFGYPSLFLGRGDGVAAWGDVAGGMFCWRLGVFDGREGMPNGDDHPLYAGRLTLNLLDPEPGYSNASTHFGGKDILSLGVGASHQTDAAGTVAEPKSYTGVSVDLLAEKRLGPGGASGVATLEGAWYRFDTGEATLSDGNSWFVLGAYLLPGAVGYGPVQGRVQPYLRYQRFNRANWSFPVPGMPAPRAQIDLGANYLLAGPSAKLALVYERLDPGPGKARTDTLRLGAQFLF